jgi:mannose-6-phosphate isomerase-like protein (cupin superfamily)
VKQIGKHYLQDKLYEIEFDEKKWGSESIIDRGHDGDRGFYATKIMTLKPRFQVSNHWHANKVETFLLVAGEIIVEIMNPAGDKSIVKLTEPFSSITIQRNTPHTFYTPDDQVGDTIFIESSTTDYLDDSYRVTKSGPRK